MSWWRNTGDIETLNNWSQELKNTYDAFPRLNVVFSGSSSIDLIGGTHNLARNLEVDDKTALHYLHIADQSGATSPVQQESCPKRLTVISLCRSA